MWRLTSLLIFIVLVFTTCSGSRQVTSLPPENGYTTSFPKRDMSDDLSHLFQSVKRITSTAFYDTYILNPTPAVYNTNISKQRLERLAARKIYTNHSTAGTALVLSSSSTRILLLTCAHVINFPDTVMQFYQPDQPGQIRPLKFVAYLDRQTNLLIDNENLGYFDIVAVDNKRDLALLGIKKPEQKIGKIPALDYPLGNAKELKMGSFTYAIGYPKGYPMITHAVVGDVMRPPYGSFLIDAPFNRGFSGGIVMALRGPSQKLEWVGIANSSSATAEYVLRPDERIINDQDLNDLYSGPIILEQHSVIDYGITKVIPVNEIIDFIRDKEKVIHEHGFSVPAAFLH